MSQLAESIRQHEGWRDKAYQDSEGVWTIGYGTNLQELKIDKQQGEQWLELQIQEATLGAGRFPEFALLNAVREDVFIEMVYNMGPKRVAGFRKMLAAIRDGEWEEAAIEMLDSKWARQVGRRAWSLAKLMETGER